MKEKLEEDILKPIKESRNFLIQKRLKELREGYGNVTKMLGKYETSNNSGEIKDARQSGNKDPMVVMTDTGVIVSKERELLTERLSACVALLIQGPEFNYLVHMTPSSNLGYYYYRHNNPSELVENVVKKIFGKLPEETSKENISVTIITNMPDETDGPYGRKRLVAAWDLLKNKIKSIGVKSLKIKELPTDETLLYLSPLTPDTVYAIGNKIEVGEKGNYVFGSGEVVEETISLD